MAMRAARDDSNMYWYSCGTRRSSYATSRQHLQTPKRVSGTLVEKINAKNGCNSNCPLLLTHCNTTTPVIQSTRASPEPKPGIL